MTLKIAVVGTKGSGSTRLYNLIRITFEKLNYNINTLYEYNNKAITTFEHVAKHENPFHLILKKVHDCNLENIKDYNFILLPMRHPFDSAISNNKRWKLPYIKCIKDNIFLYNKFKSISDVVFFYEKYSLDYIKQLYASMEKKINIRIPISDNDIEKIMIELEQLLNSKDLPTKDDANAPFYKMTILSKHHNTSNGKSNKFLEDMTEKEIKTLLNDKAIYNNLMELDYLKPLEKYL